MVNQFLTSYHTAFTTRNQVESSHLFFGLSGGKFTWHMLDQAYYEIDIPPPVCVSLADRSPDCPAAFDLWFYNHWGFALLMYA